MFRLHFAGSCILCCSLLSWSGDLPYNGAVVPADTPEVALARAAHLGQLGHVIPVGYVGYPYAAYPYAAGLVVHAKGFVVVVPADEPAVYAVYAVYAAKDKVAHAAAGGVINPVGVYALAYAVLVVPLEHADVVAACAAPLAAVAAT
jgi:hypothetical protein